MKKTKKYSFTRTLHYMNIDTCQVSKEDLEKTTIYTALMELTGGKEELFKEVPLSEKTKFLLHFLQEITQPLHSYGKGRGGNFIKVIRNKNNRNKTTNLHKLWDEEIPMTFATSGEYLPTLRNVTILDVISFNLKISCSYVYNFKNNYIIFEDYYRQDIVEEMFDNYISLATMYLS